MTMSLRALVQTSALTGVVLTAVGGLLGGAELATGIFVTGLVMVANLWGWSIVVGSAIGAARSARRPGLAVALYGLKVGALGVSLLVLLSYFSVISVILGSSVVLGSVSLWAVRGAFHMAKAGDA